VIARLGILAAAALALAAPAQAGTTTRADASAAVARVEAVLHGSPLRPPVDVTLAMRDLAIVADRLPPAAKRRADALLDRPDDPGGSRGGGVSYTVPSTTFCTTHFCVHYVPTTVDAPPPRDANGNGTPDWVETTAQVLEGLWQKEVVEYGFRAPPTDLVLANHGPDARFDVYLADIVDQGVLGFCSPEPPPNYQFWNVPGYCVLDNDYSPAQIGAPGLADRAELELTAVHEFFHAIQFGYDFSDDTWLLEGTATWIEDSVYDSLDEPYGRFPYSALRQPQVSLDTVSPTTPYQYGSWVFWRFVEELLAQDRQSHIDPSVIRRVWEYADGSPGAPDLYSLQAVAAVLAEHGLVFPAAFLRFAVANAAPGSFYREGRSWPASPLARTSLLRSGGAAKGTFGIDHLASRYIAFVPGPLVGRRARLAISVDLPPTARGSTAAALVFRRTGASATKDIRLSGSGDGRVTVPFGRGVVKRVVLVLANASTRLRCGLSSPFSCRGLPLDDGLAYRYSARLEG
jgi:hypothetical protein